MTIRFERLPDCIGEDGTRQGARLEHGRQARPQRLDRLAQLRTRARPAREARRPNHLADGAIAGRAQHLDSLSISVNLLPPVLSMARLLFVLSL